MTLEWHLVLGVFSGILQVLSIVPYIRDMLKGTTRPNVISQSLWTLIQAITVAAQISAGASWSVILLVAMTFNTLLVVVLCLWGYGYKQYGWFDSFCLIASLGSIVAWQITQNPLWALLIAFAANIFASLPTVVKAYKDPDSENPTAWLTMTAASVLSIFSTTIFNVPNLLFPIYFVGESGLIGGLALVGRKLKKKPR